MLKNKDRGRFKNAAMNPSHSKWQNAVSRQTALYTRTSDIRTDFGRDYTRILHSTAYRRLKHKTQVYFSPENDRISTRIDHVHYVVSISRLIADFLGLNGELTEAIAIGHDLGHAPFGHVGEEIIAGLAVSNHIGDLNGDNPPFWHGKQGLHMVDDLELLTGPDGKEHHLNLTYAVRDGIISHSGSVENHLLKPRKEAIDLQDFNAPGQWMPYTWEACVVKIADNVAYLGRDIDDAAILGLIDDNDRKSLTNIVQSYAEKIGNNDLTGINNANIINLLVTDLCANSSPDTGIGFSEAGNAVAEAVLAFNRSRIYSHPRLKAYQEYGEVIIQRLYRVLSELCTDYDELVERYLEYYPTLIGDFSAWICQYWDRKRDTHLANRVIYPTLTDPAAWQTAILDYIAAMTDRYIERVYHEQITF